MQHRKMVSSWRKAVYEHSPGADLWQVGEGDGGKWPKVEWVIPVEQLQLRVEQLDAANLVSRGYQAAASIPHDMPAIEGSLTNCLPL